MTKLGISDIDTMLCGYTKNIYVLDQSAIMTVSSMFNGNLIIISSITRMHEILSGFIIDY